MKSRLVMTALAASLFAAAGVASAQQTYYRTAQVPGQTTPDTWTESGADARGQPGDTSYGGAPSTRGDTGSTSMRGTVSKPCVRGPQCDIFFGD